MGKRVTKKMMLSLAIVCPSLFVVLLSCFVLVITGTVTLSVSGFAVDHFDRLYIGTTNEIRVYEESRIVKNISPHTSRTYVFTIQEGENILLSTSTKVYVMDLDGNVLETKEDPGADIYNQLSYQKGRFISDKGDIYRMSSVFGWTRITKNSTEIVYQIDVLSFCVKLLLAICAIVIFVFPVWALIEQRLGDK